MTGRAVHLYARRGEYPCGIQGRHPVVELASTCDPDAVTCRRCKAYVVMVRSMPPAQPDDRAGPLPCSRCLVANSAGLCCSTHRRWLCHRCYRRTHWVEVCVEGCKLCAREGLPMALRGTDDAGSQT